MATTHRIINGIACNTCDWHNCERSLMSINNPLDQMIQAIMRHPMKDCLSIPWLFSYNYQMLREKLSVEESRTRACAEVLKALDSLQ